MQDSSPTHMYEKTGRSVSQLTGKVPPSLRHKKNLDILFCREGGGDFCNPPPPPPPPPGPPPSLPPHQGKLGRPLHPPPEDTPFPQVNYSSAAGIRKYLASASKSASEVAVMTQDDRGKRFWLNSASLRGQAAELVARAE